MKNLIVSTIFTAMLSACASPQYNYQPTSQAISFPEIGVVSTVGVGETMVSQGNFIERESIKISQPVTVGLVGTYTFQPGYYSKVGSDGGSSFYLPEQSPEGGRVQTGPLTDPFQAIQFMSNSKEICGVSIYGGKVCTKSPTITEVKRPSLESSAFQQNLIYSGRIGSKINVGYREFSNNTARPAFNNDVEYDLLESQTIGYKGAELDVIEATNRSITYRLIRNFNTIRK